MRTVNLDTYQYTSSDHALKNVMDLLREISEGDELVTLLVPSPTNSREPIPVVVAPMSRLNITLK